jgi:hypothetical protein
MITLPSPTAAREALQRRTELREAWLERPANYPPPRGSHPDLVHDHHRRWLASVEYAHCCQILRDAGLSDDTPPAP